ncbi:MAG TPA: CAP domain-containing protein [Solirubrobacterales bacterium]|nr:CAP domain-containing protein [Solirubrobacterales bacterium]
MRRIIRRPPLAGVVLATGAAILLAATGPGPAATVGLSAGEAEARCKGARANPGNVKPGVVQRATMCLINKRRAKRGLPALTRRKSLRRAAKRHSVRMRDRQCFSHTCGGDLLKRVSRTSYLPCGCSWGAGETLGWGAGSRGQARRMVRAWMSSSGHRAVILDRRFRHFGVGVVWGSPYRSGDSSHATYTAIFGYKN